ncbi:DNA methyltransferase [Treponema phagedenis]|uniref:DNA methyltransferase n=1 Tax=Treponema phagedenis TaxID=162 RepID=UPI0019812C38|nr:DNA methyltransferase [Treponema phagedenis]QSH94977.1 restriction endonuclease subunit M [Treponema phagedenis]
MQKELFIHENGSDLISIPEAGHWASRISGKKVTNSNISYLIQYGRINKFSQNGGVAVSKAEVIDYYASLSKQRQQAWQDALSNDVNWALSFEEYKEAETTKHVHRLHPYKGKFIPQLVEYFLDNHTDAFKTEVFFKQDDIILDPFCGSGTTLIQANELGMHSIGIDVSAFNAMISNAKIDSYNLLELESELTRITHKLQDFVLQSNISEFEEQLSNALMAFNAKYFPSPEFKIQVRKKEIDEKKYGAEKEIEFLPQYESLVKKFSIELKQKSANSFLEKWYMQNIRNEIDFVFKLIEKIDDDKLKTIAKVILSRTIRSCRATTHSDLATIYEPVIAPYYCSKHGKICKPLFSILKWWQTYSKDTVKRLAEFSTLKTNTFQYCLTGDSRNVNIFDSLQSANKSLYELAAKNKISGIFSSPPYVGMIDYHEQHAYAYDLFGFSRNDELEIGPLFKGKGKEARESYIQGISAVLNNAKKYLKEDYHVFLVANDKFNMYPVIAENAGMKIINQYHRPVLNRTEKDKGAYSETIFHMREK